MKTYQRITPHGDYETITTITEAGSYHHINVWSDGFTAGEYTSSLEAMGWKSLEDFLSHKKGFKLVGEEATA